MFDLVVRVAAPALFVLSAHGPAVSPRPLTTPPPVVTPSPATAEPAPTPRTTASSAPAASTAPPVTPPQTPPAAPAQLRARTTMAQVVRLTNSARLERGCPALSIDGHLVTASQRQSAYMARTRLFSHVWRDGSTFVERSRDAGYRQPAGENIAWGYRSAPEVVRAWMASPGHRKNILNCRTRSMGAGVAFAADGTPYYTQVFGWN
ncbi:CAP domain-containing protein [Actinoplanes utahensis]|uniref:SCP domain-containing protein n=1 Tax=Actinoplanes utahensis TaxID=1869 RepID=A0A0A6UAK0_ACTUT|nr:CAP domain-containing protein [Actinoplanes utahensis]KHD72526.1 hypothetical protein MB27_39455 [Actinoplanes utahensis]GIF29355.1 hypothetical protein Aut01nite_23410 [Actinoplanes utahensis]